MKRAPVTEWQREIIDRILRGERVVLNWPRSYGKTAFQQALDEADEVCLNKEQAMYERRRRLEMELAGPHGELFMTSAEFKAAVTTLAHGLIDMVDLMAEGARLQQGATERRIHEKSRVIEPFREPFKQKVLEDAALAPDRLPSTSAADRPTRPPQRP